MPVKPVSHVLVLPPAMLNGLAMLLSVFSYRLESVLTQTVMKWQSKAGSELSIMAVPAGLNAAAMTLHVQLSSMITG